MPRKQSPPANPPARLSDLLDLRLLLTRPDRLTISRSPPKIEVTPSWRQSDRCHDPDQSLQSGKTKWPSILLAKVRATHWAGFMLTNAGNARSMNGGDMLIKCAKENKGRLALLAMFLGLVVTAIVLNTMQYCVCSTCYVLPVHGNPCHCTSLADHLIQSALGRHDSQIDSKNLITKNRANRSHFQVPCAARL
jgi:hypothetical protein